VAKRVVGFSEDCARPSKPGNSDQLRAGPQLPIGLYLKSIIVYAPTIVFVNQWVVGSRPAWGAKLVPPLICGAVC
jgi:hypothetical protein